MKIKHKCGHETDWCIPDWMVKHYKEKILAYKSYLESMVCLDCYNLEGGIMIN